MMVDLWSNHFNVTCPSADVWDSRASYDQAAAQARPRLVQRHARRRLDAPLDAALPRQRLLHRHRAQREPRSRACSSLHTVGVGSTPSPR
nr:hypothetical protein [Angustibacter aerolatus]